MSLDLHPGERLALVGENGAGKSSLMNVLFGLYRPDAGHLELDGQRVTLTGPQAALSRGIGMVHQHFMLVPTLTVAENVVLGREPTRRGQLDLEAARAQVRQTCERFGFQLDPWAKVSELTVGSQQKVEIIKALHGGARILILDEPTAVLTPQEADELFAVVHKLSEAGHTVVFISHKLTEVLTIATRIVVMRRGKKVAETTPAHTSREQLAELMVGQLPPAPAVEASPPPGAPVAELRKVTARDAHGRRGLRELSMTICAGEIVGVAGVDGNGQRELAEVLTGLVPWQEGALFLLGQPLTHYGAAAARQLGVAHVPEDRLRRAVVLPMSVEENLALGRHQRPPFARRGQIDFAGRRARAEALISDFDIRPADPLAGLQGLSGGNQQKVVLARELDQKPRLLIAAQPTRGLDVAAVADVHRRLRALRNQGVAVVLISLDLEEVLALSDRVYVMYEGAVTGTLPRSAFDERRIGRWMLGLKDGSA